MFYNFKAPCSGIISAWCSLLHTHHRCEAFTWCDVTRCQLSCCAQCALTPDFIPPDLTRLKSCWLFFLEYHARESIPDTHSEYRRVETSASSGVGRAGPQTYLAVAIGHGDVVSMHCVKPEGDILNSICVQFTYGSLVYLLNSGPM